MQIPGKNLEEQMKNLEVILDRMFRRLHHTVIGVLPKIPICGYCVRPTDGFVGKVLIPGNGRLVAFRASVGHKEFDSETGERKPEFTLRMIKAGEYRDTYVVSDEHMMATSMQAGEVIEVRTKQNISDIAFTFTMEFKEDFFSRQDFIIDKLEQSAKAI